jgi:hypothetical protein
MSMPRNSSTGSAVLGHLVEDMIGTEKPHAKQEVQHYAALSVIWPASQADTLAAEPASGICSLH